MSLHCVSSFYKNFQDWYWEAGSSTVNNANFGYRRAGYLGGDLVNRRDCMDGAEVLVLDNFQRGYSRHSLPWTAEFRKIDIRDQEPLTHALQDR